MCCDFVSKGLESQDQNPFQYWVSNYDIRLKPAQFIDKSLVILATLSKKIVKREDLIQTIDELLCKHLHKLLEISKLKTLLLIGSLLDKVFTTIQQVDNSHDFVLKVLLESLDVNKKKD